MKFNTKSHPAIAVLAAVLWFGTFDELYAVPSRRNKSPDEAIVGGAPVASPNAYPWLVSIQTPTLDGAWEHWCGGTLLTKNLVLTAAHCIVKEFVGDPTKLIVSAWRYDVSKSTKEEQGIDFNITLAISHPGYLPPSVQLFPQNDIAILVLTPPTQNLANKKIPMLPRLATSKSAGIGGSLGNSTTVDDLLYPSQEVVAAGWGTTKDFVLALPGKLQQVRLPIVDGKTCQQQYSRYPIDDKVLCAGFPEGGRDTCKGDSGS
ncbi:hypothetical protein HK102_010105 [Quaeritorhiza haematococci]|nr:hypothetical protein HK102_010105 [Quaeritorhiza haematococci]